MPDNIHKYGTDDGWHGVIKEGGEFPPEKDRYHLYIGKVPSHHLLSLKRLQD
jgi:putative glutathione S-transferase